MHGPGVQWKKDKSSSIKELLGKWFFLLYALAYGGFIFINVTNPGFMGVDIGGFNIAIAYGFGLIVLAMLLAFAYNHVSTVAEETMNPESGEDQESGGEGGGGQ